MAIDQQLLNLLVCPQCRGGVVVVEGGQALFCEQCKLKFPVQNNIPMLQTDLASNLKREVLQHQAKSKFPAAMFHVTQGPDAGLNFSVEGGTCRALGRAETDQNKTTIFHVDLTLSIDEGTKSLIMAYIARQFRRADSAFAEGFGATSGERLGSFHRGPDIVLSDVSISRLHTMFFSDTSGTVGLLDLVSKNGTYVNGKEVESRLLQGGDVIEIGESTMTFEGVQ